MNLLTKRELEIYNLLLNGKSTTEVAKILNISIKTVRNHISNVIQKLDVDSRMNAILELLRLGILSIKP